MAVGGNDVKDLTIDSDEIEDMFCEHCEKKSRKHVRVAAFCGECLEFMCSVCLPYHNKFNTEHTIMEENRMPEHFCMDKCKVHSEEIVKFYCERCSITACPECKKAFHSDQCALKFIPDIVQNCDSNKLRKDLQEQIEIFLNNLKDTTKEICEHVLRSSQIASKVHSAIEIRKQEMKSEIETQRKNVLDDLERKREETLKELDKEKADKMQCLDEKLANIMSLIDKAQETISAEALKLTDTDQSKLDDINSKAESMKTELESLQQHVNSVQASVTQMFVAMHTINTLEKDYVEMLRDNYVQNYAFESGKVQTDINEVKFDVNSFGILRKSKLSKDKRNISLIGSISMKDKHRKWDDSIVDICQISNCRLVVIGNVDKRLKLIDTQQKKVLSMTPLSSPAFALTKISEDQVAVSLPEEKKIQFYSVSTQDQLLLINEIIGLDLRYSGLSYSQPNLYFTAGGKVLSMDFASVSMGKPEIRQLGDTQLSPPNRIVYNPKLKTMYISDVKTVVGIDFTGRFLFKSKPLTNEICDLALDPNTDTLYVIVFGILKGKVYQMSSDLADVYELMKGVTVGNGGVCYSNGKLYCGTIGDIYILKLD